MLLSVAVGNTADTLSFAALIVDGGTHFDKGPFGLGRGDSRLKNLYKLMSAFGCSFAPLHSRSRTYSEASYAKLRDIYEIIFVEKKFVIVVTITKITKIFVPESLELYGTSIPHK